MKAGLTLLLHGRNNPRNSEGSFVTLRDGRILFAYSRFQGKKDWGDHATGRICARISADDGVTWSARDVVWVENEGRCNVMSVSLLRLQDGRIALFYGVKNGLEDCKLYLRTSSDEAKSWSKRVCCIPAPGYFVVNNDRVIQLRNGRIVVPATFHRLKRSPTGKDDYGSADMRGIGIFFLSDDGGKTWYESTNWVAAPRPPRAEVGYPLELVKKRKLGAWLLDQPFGIGLQETGVLELKDGRLYAWFRTNANCQYESHSGGGRMWTDPKPSWFQGPLAPLSIKRLPNGDLLAVWNDHDRKHWRLPVCRPSSWGRTPLATAISPDDGQTWTHRRLLERDPARGFCYTAIHSVEDAVLLAYCCGGRGSAVLQDLCIRRLPLAWFYGKERQPSKGSRLNR